MSEIHELAVIEVKEKKQTAKQAESLAAKWVRFIMYAKELCPEVLTPEILERAETAKLAHEFALMEVEQSERIVNSALRKVLREKEAYGLKIEELSQRDIGRRIVVLLGPKTEEMGELAGWTKTSIIVRWNYWGRLKTREVKPGRCRWAV